LIKVLNLKRVLFQALQKQSLKNFPSFRKLFLLNAVIISEVVIMKKAVLTFICVVILMGIAGVAAINRPYSDLKAEDIVSAKVTLTPPEKTVTIEDKEELAALMNALVTYNRDQGYLECCGQGVVFELTLADGKTQSINAYNPYLVIDDVGYKTSYEPCAKLADYANGLIG